MSYENVADDGDNPVDNPNMYNEEIENRLSHSLQHLVARSTTPDNWMCVEKFFFFSSVP